jgi:hypothetical protein
MQQVQRARNHVSGAEFSRRQLLNPSRNGAMSMDSAQAVAVSRAPAALTDIGLDITTTALNTMSEHHNISVQHAMDMILAVGQGMDTAGQPNITPGSVVTPIQFLQEFLPGAVEIITQVRKADEFIGMSNIGSWFQETIVQAVLERQGKAASYTDQGNTNLGTWNQIFETRGIQRHEMGLQVGRLEQARASEIRVDSAGQKRSAVMIELEIIRNQIAFFGFNQPASASLTNPTFGILNDPGLGAYKTVPAYSGGQGFENGTFQEIKNTIMEGVAFLQTQSKGRVMPESQPITMGIALSSYVYLAQVTDFGVSVIDWMAKSLANVRVVAIPEFDLAVSGTDNVMYMQADSVMDSGTDDQNVWLQAVQSKLFTLGVQQKTKGFEEAYLNATAGAMCKRPYAVVRFSGV